MMQITINITQMTGADGPLQRLFLQTYDTDVPADPLALLCGSDLAEELRGGRKNPRMSYVSGVWYMTTGGYTQQDLIRDFIRILLSYHPEAEVTVEIH